MPKTSFNKNRQKSLVVPLDGEGILTAKAIIANMIVTEAQAEAGEISRLVLQGKFRLKPEMLNPVTMGFERAVLRAMISMESHKMPATLKNLEGMLKIDDPEAEAKLLALSYHHTEPPQVESLSTWLGDWIERQAMIVAAKAILERLRLPEGSTNEAYQEAMQIMTSVAPVATDITERSGQEMFQEWEINQRERKARLKNNKPLGPSWPWTGLVKKIPYLKKGEMTTILAKTKHGKSAIGVILAEYMAHTCGYDVVFFHLETSANSIMDRIISRKLEVQSGALRSPEVFDIDVEPYKTKYLAAKAEYDKSQERGEIHYVHCPGISYSTLESKLAQYNALAQGRGRELVVFVDYHSEIDWSELSTDETKGLNAGASELKRMTESQGVYMIVFAQFGVDVDYGAKKAGWGSSKIVSRAQVVIRVEREDATDTQKIPDGDKKDAQGQPVQKKDCIGVPMFYHEAGQPSSDVFLNVLFANDDAIGPVPIKAYNAYYKMIDHPHADLMLQSRFASKTPKKS